MIELKNINKSFKENVLLENVSANFFSQKTKIKGHNGSGKSVLMKMIVGFSVPDEGEVYYDGTRLQEECDFLPNAGISINAPEFMKNWTGKENLMYLAQIKDVKNTKIIDELIDYFDLRKSINKKYKHYSLGMKQKMRIIQALMSKPKYLILDEPFDALDQNTKESLKKLLDNYLKQDDTRQLVFTSHEEDDDIFADELYLIDNRKLKKLMQ